MEGEGDVRLMLGDCLERMGEIPGESVGLILADLPYGTTACRWDVVIPFRPLWAEYGRLLKPGCAVVLTACQPFTSMLVMSNPAWFRYEWIWSKRMASGYLDANRKPMRAHESILVFAPSRPRYFPQLEPRSVAELSRMRRHDLLIQKSQVYQAKEHICIGRDSGHLKRPRSVIEIDGLVSTSKERQAGKHPTQKPVALMEYMIRTYSEPGDTVLDNTMGSGTTGVACVNSGRHFIGIDSDPAYFAIAERRIAAARSDAPLFDLLEAVP